MAKSGKGEQAQQIQQMMNALGGMAEMAHQVYTAFIKSGADRMEATAGMTAWIAAFWHETSEDARRKKGEADGDNEHPG